MGKFLAVMLLATAADAQTTGAISGTVNIPIPVAVEAYTATANAADARLVSQAITDGNHQYTIGGLAPGSYYVRTRIADPTSPFIDVWYNSAFVAAPGARPVGVVVAGGTTTGGINLTPIDFSGRISGTLTLAALPFKGVVDLPAVQVYNATGVLVRTAQLTPTPGASAGSVITSDPPAGGTWTWTVAGLPSGAYYVKTSSTATPSPNNGHAGGTTGGWWVDEVYGNIACVAEDCLATRGTPISVTSGVNGGGSASGTSIDLALDYGAVISGATINPGFDLDPVEIFDARGVRLPRRSTLEALSFGRSYFANGLPTGSYFLRRTRGAASSGPSILYRDTPCEGCSVTSGTPVSVRLGESKSGIDIVAAANGGIRGTVRTGGAPTGQVVVSVYAHSGELAASGTTASDGTYAVAGLAPGSYYVQTSNAAGFVDEVYDNLPCPGCQPWRGTAVTVTAALDSSGIDFDLAAGAAVSGLVQAVPDSAASSWPVAGIGVLFYTSAGVLAGRAVSDTTGRYNIAIGPGTYYSVSEATPGYIRRLYINGQCAGGTCALDTGTPIPVAGNPVTNVDFALAQCTPGSLAPVSLATAAVGSPYRQTLLSTGSADPVYEVSAGRLPPGLTLDAVSGVLSGTPTTAGRYTFTIATGTCVTTRTYTLDVPGCLVDVPTSVVSRASGEPFLLTVTTNCPSWTATSNDSWISMQTPAANPTSVLIVASPNPGTTPRRGSITVGSRIVVVYQNALVRQPPFGVLEAPANGAVLSGSFGVSGWALDDLAVSRVQIYRSPAGGEGSDPVYLGDATFVDGARPDVEAAYPGMPRNSRAGFGYMLLSNMLPDGGNGVFTLFAYADDIDGVRTLIGTRIVTLVNSTATSPFGAIDKPEQGATISGNAYVNWGWVLTPQPKSIPFDGSTIDVLVDGVKVGNPSAYNLFRTDVTGQFPGLKNSGGPVGFRELDTTALAEGVHTIAWTVRDDAGQAAGIGSRYFTVRNSAWVPSSISATATLAPVLLVPERIDGVDAGRQAASLDTLTADGDGTRKLSVSSQNAVSLRLGNDDGSCAPRYEGYLVAGGELRALPAGSALDQRGRFTWQPGPAFHGTYRLVFVRTSCEGARERIPVEVSVR